MRNGWKLPGFESPDPKPSARPEPKVKKKIESFAQKVLVEKYLNI